MKKLILGLLILILISSGCLSNQTDGSVGDLYGYFDKAASIEELVTNMKNDGFRYDNDLNDISYATDTHVEPEVVFNRKYGNCQDYAYFYKDYFDRKQITSEIWLFRNGWKWHYVVYSGALCISNIEYSYKSRDAWFDEGWQYQRKVE